MRNSKTSRPASGGQGSKEDWARVGRGVGKLGECGNIGPRKEFQEGGGECILRAAELSGMMRMEKCPRDLERASVIPARSISEASWVKGGLQWIENCLLQILAHHLPCHPGLKTDELLQFLLYLYPYPSSLLNHFQVLFTLSQHYLLLLSSFHHSYCHFTNSDPASNRTSEFYKHLLCAAILCCM